MPPSGRPSAAGPPRLVEPGSTAAMASGTSSAMRRTCSSFAAGSGATQSVGYQSTSGRAASSGAHAAR